MFLSFGRKNTPGRKPGTPIESPKKVSSSGASPVVDVGSRSAVQTVAGPLLSSTRFNTVLDASTFANVNSPGFTSRVVNCASNGSSPYDNSATHQNKYSSVGLFPRVQLGGQSILPLLSPRISQKVGRTPVRVRIAPPERRHSFCGGPLDASKDGGGIFKQLPSSTEPNLSKDSNSTPTNCGKNGPSDNQESSRKRIFSESQDACDDAKKRRRKAEIPIPNPNNDIYHYRHVRAPAIPSSPPQLVASSQGKRAREKGSPEEQKHQRRKTCNTNNAIFSSLSSSRNLLERLTAQKRKSVDTSRSSSPLTPLCGRQVKESKTVTDVKAVQCNLDGIPQRVKFTENTSSSDGTPISSKGILKRGDANSRRSDENSIKGSLNGSQPTPTCDYTTKLFRKETSSNTPKIPVTKSQKQSLWIQAPEADELTCSLLGDDANLDRPERLKSLLACVSGKDKKLEDSKTVALTSVSTGVVKGCAQSTISGIALPSSTSSNLLSPSSALTVTVSSTCTIMTSATVTSVNGVPSSESGSSPPSRPTTSSSTLSTSLNTSAPPVTGATSSSSGTNVAAGLTVVSKNTAVLSSSSSFKSSSVDLSKQISTGPNESIKSSLVFTMKSPVSGTESSKTITSLATLPGTPQPVLQVGASSVATSTLKFGSSVTTSAIEIAANTSSPASKPTFQFGAPTEKSSSIMSPTFPTASTTNEIGSAKPSFQLGSNSSASPIIPMPALQFGSGGSSTNVSSEVPKPAFSFGSNAGGSTSAPKPTLQFGSSAPVASGPTEAPKAAFSFGASETGTSKPALKFGSGGSAETSKPAFSFGSSGGGSSLTPKPALQFGSSVPVPNGLTEAPKAAFSFGTSGAVTSKPALQFGSSAPATSGPAEAPKAAFSFGASETGTSKPALQFGSGGSAATSKPAFSFGSSGSGSSLAPKPTLQFGSSAPVANGPTEASTAAFSFGTSGSSISGTPKPAFQFASNGPAINGSSGTPKPAFSFGSSGSNIIESSKPSLSFGGNTVASSSNTNSSTGSGNSFQFGQTSSSMSATQNINGATDATKSPFQFSSGLSNKTMDSSKPAFQFSSNSTEKPSFGSQASGSVFGQSVPQQSKGAFSFGSGSSNNFGSGSSPTAFGSPTTNTQSSLPSFGSLADSKPNGFGSAPNFGSSDSRAFSFSSNTAPPSSMLNASGNNGSFTFGQKQDQGPQSYNFNASVTAVPNSSGQATQAPGLFSVGAGSSQRRVQTARRRR